MRDGALGFSSRGLIKGSGTSPGCDGEFFFHVSNLAVTRAIGEIYVSYDFDRICILICEFCQKAGMVKTFIRSAVF